MTESEAESVTEPGSEAESVTEPGSETESAPESESALEVSDRDRASLVGNRSPRAPVEPWPASVIRAQVGFDRIAVAWSEGRRV